MASLETFGASLLSLQATLFGLIVESGGAYLFLPILFAAAITFFRIDRDKRRATYPLLIALPAISVLTIVWGLIFYFDPTSGRPENPPWVGFSLLFAPWLVLLLGTLFILRLHDATLFALLYTIVNLYAVVVVTFIALMAVTGSWL